MTRLKILLADLMLILVMCASVSWLILMSPAQASGCYKCVTNEYHTTEVTRKVTTVTEGISNSDLASGLTMTASAGAHQFDFSTTDWQGSITGAWYDDHDAVSFGIGKRFSEDFLPNVLLHGNYTQNGDEQLFVIGGTFRF
jgi:opacity protein-like surface antigen